ncbi:hypothetical protein PX52LOC_02036 [Limnoglobus roseus]|uniref:Uncharacterized protein n=1 Tax=Limnoglobus roseus TaxID=2598579 RepID=A0A5C1AA92_9BACT|nr:hypothetical protein PX52LOC_02036 [Limnoglobus roseus]
MRFYGTGGKFIYASVFFVPITELGLRDSADGDQLSVLVSSVVGSSRTQADNRWRHPQRIIKLLRSFIVSGESVARCRSGQPVLSVQVEQPMPEDRILGQINDHGK